MDSALGGAPVTASPQPIARYVLSAAADAIAVLHRTRDYRRRRARTRRRWVDAPLGELLRHTAVQGRSAYRLERLRDELHAALDTGSSPAAWIHGDFWLGNLLFYRTLRPTGIVDWEASAPLELPLHDVLHLLLYTRRLTSGRELGQMLLRPLAEALVSRGARTPGAAAGVAGGGRAVPAPRASSLWLRHAAVHARQHGLEWGADIAYGSAATSCRCWRHWR